MQQNQNSIRIMSYYLLMNCHWLCIAISFVYLLIYICDVTGCWHPKEARSHHRHLCGSPLQEQITVGIYRDLWRAMVEVWDLPDEKLLKPGLNWLMQLLHGRRSEL
jgi:hypothetical protein